MSRTSTASTPFTPDACFAALVVSVSLVPRPITAKIGNRSGYEASECYVVVTMCVLSLYCRYRAYIQGYVAPVKVEIKFGTHGCDHLYMYM